MKTIKSMCFIFFFLVLGSAWAQTPITIKGMAVDSEGLPLPDGNKKITFSIYNSKEGKTPLWTEQQDVAISDGIFSVKLGTVNPLDFTFNQSCWLGIKIGNENEMTPRMQLKPTSEAVPATASSKISSDSGAITLTVNTLDDAYDGGGSGLGRTITADAGAVNIAGPHGLTVEGAIGIGTTNPTQLLEIRKNAMGVRMLVRNEGGGGGAGFEFIDDLSGADWKIKATQFGGFKIRDQANTRDVMGFDTNGNIGIGTLNPTRKLEVKGAVWADNGGSDTPGDQQSLVIGANGMYAYRMSADGMTLHLDRYSGDWQPIPILSMQRQTGNVGIGKMSPGAKLHIGGASGTQGIILSSEDGAGNHRIQFNDGGVAKWILERVDSSNQFRITEEGVGNHFVAQPGGNIGIGTTSPSDPLHVIGNLRIDNDTDAANKGCFRYNGVSNQLEYSNDCTTYQSFSTTSGGGWTDDGVSVRLTTATDNVGIGTGTPGAKLDVMGAIRNSGPPSSTVLFKNVNESGIPDNDGFRIRYDDEFFGPTTLDALVFEKTDGNSESPDGGIAFVNTGNDGIAEPALVIKGASNAVGIGIINPTQALEVSGNIHSTGWIKSGTSIKIDGINDQITATSGLIDFDDENLKTSGIFESTSGGFKFPDGTTQTTAATGGSGDGHSLDAADGSPTDAVYVDNVGNVGIGTTSPVEFLDLFSTADTDIQQTTVSDTEYPFINWRRARNGPSIVVDAEVLGQIGAQGFDGTSYITSSYILFRVDGTPSTNDMPGSMEFYTTADGASSGTFRMILKPDGNVGIGTPTPSEKLEVNGKISANAYTSTSPLIFEAPAGTERMRIDDTNGNLGIGTTNPGAKLEVAGQVKITGGAPGAGKVLTSDGTGLATWQTPSASPDGDWIISGSNMYSAVSNNVGIGTTNPLSKLSVGGNGNASYSIWGETSLSSGGGVYGYATGNNGRGVYGTASGITGRGVLGLATYGNTTNYGGYFEARGITGRGVYGIATYTGNATNYGGYFQANGYMGQGVYAIATYTGSAINYGGYFEARGGSGYGVYGSATGSSGIGVYGKHTSSGNYGILGRGGEGTFGVGTTSGAYGSGGTYGVYGAGGTYGIYGASNNYAVYGRHNSTSNYGYLGTGGYGVYGRHNASGAYGYLGAGGLGVYGYGSTYGVQGFSPSNYGVYGRVGNGNHGYVGHPGYGVYGIHNSSGNFGYLGSGGYGVYGRHGGSGRWAYLGGGGYAGYFSGNVHVSGTLSKSAGSFKIDHPLDPENKYLSHSFVESPDMMNIYNGNVVLDRKGEAVIELPEWFEALNRDFRYQLTCIGGFAQVYIEEEVTNNRFRIAGGNSGMKVSWQVTGIRKDAFANANRIKVEEMKTGKELGKYMHPEAHGVAESLGIDYQEQLKAEQETRKNQEEQARMQQQLQEDASQRKLDEQRKQQDEIEHQRMQRLLEEDKRKQKKQQEEYEQKQKEIEVK